MRKFLLLFIATLILSVGYSQTAFEGNFDANAPIASWKVIDLAGTGSYGHAFNFFGKGNGTNMTAINSYDGTSVNVKNDWLISPSFNLSAGTTYYIIYDVYSRPQYTSFDGREDYELKLGTDTTVASMTQLIYNVTGYGIDAWETKVHTFTVATTGTYRLGIHSNTPANIGNYIGFDNFKVTNNYCPNTLSNLSFSNVNSDGFSLNFNNSDAINDYKVIFKTESSTTFDTISLSATNHTFTNFDSGTLYYVNVVKYCSTNNSISSPISNKQSTHTKVLLPYSTDFSNATNNHEFGWLTKNEGNYGEWEISSSTSFPSNATQGNVFHINSYDGTESKAKDDWLISPKFQEDSGLTYFITMKVKTNGGSFGNEVIKLYANNGSNPSEFTDLFATETITSNPNFGLYAYAFEADTNDDVAIAIKAVTALGVGNYISIDDVKIDTIFPNFPLVVKDITSSPTSFDLTWYSAFNPTPHNYYVKHWAVYDSANYNGSLSTTDTTATVGTYPNNYYVAMQICNVWNNDTVCETYFRNTDCGSLQETTVTTFPYEEGFESNNKGFNLCNWDKVDDNDDSFEWKVSTSSKSGVRSMFINWNSDDNTVATDDHAYSAPLQMSKQTYSTTTNNYNMYEVSFWYKAGSTVGTTEYRENFDVAFYSTKGTKDYIVKTFEDVLENDWVYFKSTEPTDAQKLSVVPEDQGLHFLPVNNDNYYLGFHAYSEPDKSGIWIDDVKVAHIQKTGLEILVNTAVKIFPNPSDGNVSIYLADANDSKVVIYDNSGREVFNKANLNGTEKIELNNLATGMYNVQVINGDFIIKNEKLVINKK